MYLLFTPVEIIAKLIIWSPALACIILSCLLLRKVANLDTTPEEDTPIASKAVGMILCTIGVAPILYYFFAPDPSMANLAPELSTMYIPELSTMYSTGWGATILVGYGVYFMNMKKSPRSNWIKVSKVFAHICGVVSFSLISLNIYIAKIREPQVESIASLYIIALVLAVISAILFWLSYRHKEKHAAQMQPTLFDVVDINPQVENEKDRHSTFDDSIDVIICKSNEKQEKENIVERTNDNTHQEKMKKTYHSNRLSTRIKNIYSLVKSNLRLVLATAAVSSVITLAIVKFPWNKDYNKVYIPKDFYSDIYHADPECDWFFASDPDFYVKVDISEVKDKTPCPNCCHYGDGRVRRGHL